MNESVFTTKSTIDKLLISCYSPLNGYINGVWGITSGPDNCFFGDLCAGNIHKGSTPGDLGELLQMERFTATSENARIRDKWVLVYGAIERCNDVLTHIAQLISSNSLKFNHLIFREALSGALQILT